MTKIGLDFFIITLLGQLYFYNYKNMPAYDFCSFHPFVGSCTVQLLLLCPTSLQFPQVVRFRTLGASSACVAGCDSIRFFLGLPCFATITGGFKLLRSSSFMIV